jgi:hypothetical protein
MYSFLLALGVWMPVGAAMTLKLLELFPSLRWSWPERTGFVVILYLTQGVGLVANLAAIAFLIFGTTDFLDPIVHFFLHGLMAGLCLFAIIMTAVEHKHPL